MERKQYRLVFDIYEPSRSLRNIRDIIKKPLLKYHQQCPVTIKKKKQLRYWYECTISGSLEDVDACHQKFTNEALEHLYIVRKLDEVSDNIRKRAYPILSRIEQDLRGFIAFVMADMEGGDWWEGWTPKEEDKKNERIKNKSHNDHPIESTDFLSLIRLMTAEQQEWSEKKAISVKELKDVLVSATSFETFRSEVTKRTKKRSVWDDIFPLYIKNTQEWTDLKDVLEKKSLTFAIELCTIDHYIFIN